MHEIWPAPVSQQGDPTDPTTPESEPVQPDIFTTKRRVTRCYDHIAVGGRAVLDQVFGQDLPHAFVRDKWEHIVWCVGCRQWVALKKGCVTAHN